MMKRTKIIATIGPACAEVDKLTKMIEGGMNVARLNFSHGNFVSHAKLIANIREASKKLEVPVAIMQDLSGPKLRLGEFKDRVLTEGESVRIGGNGIPVQRHIWKWIKKGQTILIDDGLVELMTAKINGDSVDTKVIVGGTIKSYKGVSLPGVKVDLPSLSEKDMSDLEFGLKSGVDLVALSFVKSASDIQNLRKIIKKISGGYIPIVAKIETVEALKNIESIIKATDAVMVARGDLALNVAQQLVPLYQKKIVKLAIEHSVPVIVATQMLDSMINNPRPTRAEISDVANAVIDHVDAVMLSGETAFGKYPVKTVETMASIIREIESSPLDDIRMRERRSSEFKSKQAILSHSLIHIAQHSKAKAIVVSSISTASSLSHFRTETEIILVSKNEHELRVSNLVWGVVPVSFRNDLMGTLKSTEVLLRGERFIDASGIKISASIQSVT